MARLSNYWKRGSAGANGRLPPPNTAWGFGLARSHYNRDHARREFLSLTQHLSRPTTVLPRGRHGNSRSSVGKPGPATQPSSRARRERGRTGDETSTSRKFNPVPSIRTNLVAPRRPFGVTQTPPKPPATPRRAFPRCRASRTPSNWNAEPQQKSTRATPSSSA